MGAFFLTGMSDVACPMAVHPDWRYRDAQTLIASRHRTRGGGLFSYHWGGFHRFSFGLRFVDSADQARINQWWETGDEVAFTFDSSQTPATVLCRLVNEHKPIDRFVEPYQDWFEGDLRLESIAGTEKWARPFILDDGVFGLLDQPYNALL